MRRTLENSLAFDTLVAIETFKYISEMTMRSVRWRAVGLALVVGTMAFMTGCASVTHGTTQQVKIETLTAGGEVVNGAECRVANDKSDVVVSSGQTTSIRRSGVNLSIECEQAGRLPASGQAISRINTGMVGNLLIGGLVGVAIDSGTGAGFNYPSWIQLVFGEVRNFDRGAETDSARPTAGIRLGLTQMATATTEPSVAAAVSPPSPTPAQPVTTVPTLEPMRSVVKASSPVPDVSPAAPASPTAQPPQAQEPMRPTTRVSMDDLRALLPAKP